MINAVKFLVCINLLFCGLLTNAEGRSERRAGNVAVTLDECVEELLSRSVSKSSRSVIRIAVLPFVPTQKEYEADNQFGTYFAEVLIGKLTSRKEFRVFERSRLDAVTKELALNLSGLINENEAKKIGELAPIDYILTGTFTKMKSEVQVNGRIINVVSGEIDAGFSRRLALNEQLASLFPEIEIQVENQNTGAPDVPVTPQDPCEKMFNEFRPLFKNKDYAAIAEKAVKIPFTDPCASIHSDVLYIFTKEHYISTSYHAFCVKQIGTSENPDKVAGYLRGAMQYCTIDGTVDKEEWANAVKCMSRSMKRSQYLSGFFGEEYYRPEITESELSNLKNLMDDYINSVGSFTDGKGSSARIMDFLDALDSRGSKPDLRLFFHWVKKYSAGLQSDNVVLIMNSIKEMYAPNYLYSRDSSLYYDMTNTMAGLTKTGEITTTTSEAIYRFLWIFLYEAELKTFFQHQLQVYTLQCKQELEKVCTFFPKKYFDDRMIRYCLQYGIKVPGKVPSIDSLVQNLTRPEIRPRSDAAEMLRLVQISKPEHLSIISKALERSLVMEENEIYYHSDLINLLTESGTSDSKIHKQLIDCLLDKSKEDRADSAISAIGRMGKPVLQSLRKAYETGGEPARLQIMKAIGKMGSLAKGELAWIQSKRSGATSQVLKDQIDDTIDLVNR
jgi:TolB-like protein